MRSVRRRRRTPRSSNPRARPAAPVSPNPKRNAILGFVIALLVAAGAVALAERLDRRLHDSRDMERLTGTPLLAQVPSSAFPGSVPDPQLPIVFQTLRDSLTYFNVDQRLSSLLVISPLKGDGKTSVATNLAVAYARSGKQVILVDADLRSPQVGHPHGRAACARAERGHLRQLRDRGRAQRDRAVRLEPARAARRIDPAEPVGDARVGPHVDHARGALRDVRPRADRQRARAGGRATRSRCSSRLPASWAWRGSSRRPREAISRGDPGGASAGGRVLGMVSTGAQAGRRQLRVRLRRNASAVRRGPAPARGERRWADDRATPVTRRVRQLFRSG